jgi:hypothetical protein
VKYTVKKLEQIMYELSLSSLGGFVPKVPRAREKAANNGMPRQGA